MINFNLILLIWSKTWRCKYFPKVERELCDKFARYEVHAWSGLSTLLERSKFNSSKILFFLYNDDV